MSGGIEDGDNANNVLGQETILLIRLKSLFICKQRDQGQRVWEQEHGEAAIGCRSVKDGPIVTLDIIRYNQCPFNGTYDTDPSADSFQWKERRSLRQ